jgi:hypothetical protein
VEVDTGSRIANLKNNPVGWMFSPARSDIKKKALLMQGLLRLV